MTDKITQLYKETFNFVAEGYDHESLRFFQKAAELIPGYLKLDGNEHVLDVACGTGNATLVLANRLENGFVTGIDIAEKMLEVAEKKKNETKSFNIKFLNMDMNCLGFPDDIFDAVVSSFGIFFVNDIVKQLKHISSKVRSGGKVLTTTFNSKSFNPYKNALLEDLKYYGLNIPKDNSINPETKDGCIKLFKDAGLVNIISTEIEQGYHLKNSEEWWDIVWNSGYRGLVNQISPEKQKRFKETHNSKIETLLRENDYWIDVSVIYTIGFVD